MRALPRRGGGAAARAGAVATLPSSENGSMSWRILSKRDIIATGVSPRLVGKRLERGWANRKKSSCDGLLCDQPAHTQSREKKRVKLRSRANGPTRRRF